MVFSASARFASIPLFGWVTEAAEVSGWVSLLYLPAGVVMIALLMGGQSAALGVAAGSFGWNIVADKVDLSQNLALTAAMWGAAALSCMLFGVLRHSAGRTGPGEKPWMGYSLIEIVLFSAILAVLSPAFHHVVFAAIGAPSDIASLGAMVMGDFAGAMVLFFVLNLTASSVIHIRASRNKARTG